VVDWSVGWVPWEDEGKVEVREDGLMMGEREFGRLTASSLYEKYTMYLTSRLFH